MIAAIRKGYSSFSNRSLPLTFLIFVAMPTLLGLLLAAGIAELGVIPGVDASDVFNLPNLIFFAGSELLLLLWFRRSSHQ